jgi:exosortase
MSEVVAVRQKQEQREPLGSSPAAFRANPRALVFVALVGLVHLPLLVLHLASLWEFRPHYQAYPLLLAVIGWLAWKRRPEFSGLVRPSWWSSVLLAGGLLTLSASLLFFSPWLGALAAVLSAGGLVGRYALAGQGRDWVPVWALTWLIMPLPMDGDFRLVGRLEAWALEMASRFLDLIGVPHLMEGSVLMLPGHRMLLDQAWGGVNSPLILLSLTVIFVVATRRPWVWGVPLLVSVFAWVWLADVIRIVTVVLARAWFQADWSSGWQHEALGYATVLLGLVFLASTDYLLAFLFRPIAPKRGDSPLKQTGHDNPVSRAWNGLVGSSRKPVERSRPGSRSREAGSVGSKPSRSSGRRRHDRRDRGAATPLPRGFGWRDYGWLFAFGMLGVLQIVCLAAPVPATGSRDTASIRDWDMPDHIRGWIVVDRGTEELADQAPDGQFSGRWSFRREPLLCEILFDDPFPGWRDAAAGYADAGWRPIARRVVCDRGESNWYGPVVEVEFSNAAGQYGWLLFASLDEHGRELEPPSVGGLPGFVAELAHRAPLSRWRARGEGAMTKVTYRVQAFVTSPVRLSSPQRMAVSELFAAARTEILAGHLRRTVETERES